MTQNSSKNAKIDTVPSIQKNAFFNTFIWENRGTGACGNIATLHLDTENHVLYVSQSLKNLSTLLVLGGKTNAF